MRNDLTPLDTALALLARGLWPVAIHPPRVEIITKDGPKIAKGKEPIGTDHNPRPWRIGWVRWIAIS